MGYRKRRVAERRQGVERALAALGLAPSERAHDGWLDPAALGAALAQPSDTVLLRALPRLEGAGEGHAALPCDGLWLAIDAAGGVRSVPMCGDSARAQRARRLRLRHQSEVCCDASRCRETKYAAELTIELDDGEELLLAQHLAADRRAALAPLWAVARPLASRCAIAIEGASFDDVEAGDRGEVSKPLRAVELSRWSLAREGDLFVLRDHASHGPREEARRELFLAAAMIAGALAAWYASFRAWSSERWEHVAILGAIAAVLTLASYAMLHIARWSAKYTAPNEALLYLARDRLVIAPWVSREGAVALRPEGRYGAALSLAEVKPFELARDEEGFTLGCDSAHGPYQVGTLESEAQARAWQAALGRLAEATACARSASAPSPRRAAQAAVALLVLIGLAALGCDSRLPPAPPVSTAAEEAAAPDRPQEPPAASAAPAASVVPPLRLVEDDLEAAFEQARQSDRAVFVEVWAPWCHTCLSMKSFVLPDPSIRALADRVVFAALDSDRPANADFLERYSVNAWPTLYVLDPKDGGVLGLWQGAASVRELRELIVSSLDARDAALDPKGAVAALLEAKRAQAKSDYAAAGRHYQRALDRGGDGWARRSEALHGLLFSAYKLGQWERCATLGKDQLAHIQGAALPADASYLLLSCAGRLKNAALARQARQSAIARLREHTARPPADASVDDRADALHILAGALEDQQDRAGARAAREKQIALLEQAAAAAPDPQAASTFDYQRTLTYLELGRGEEAVAMLRERARQLPDSYEPPARLAQALVALRRPREALAAIDQAIDKSYGPRKLGYYATKLSIVEKLGDRGAERATLEALLASYEGLEPAHKDSTRLREQAQAARARLQKLR